MLQWPVMTAELYNICHSNFLRWVLRPSRSLVFIYGSTHCTKNVPDKVSDIHKCISMVLNTIFKKFYSAWLHTWYIIIGWKIQRVHVHTCTNRGCCIVILCNIQITHTNKSCHTYICTGFVSIDLILYANSVVLKSQPNDICHFMSWASLVNVAKKLILFW